MWDDVPDASEDEETVIQRFMHKMVDMGLIGVPQVSHILIMSVLHVYRLTEIDFEALPSRGLAHRKFIYCGNREDISIDIMNFFVKCLSTLVWRTKKLPLGTPEELLVRRKESRGNLLSRKEVKGSDRIFESHSLVLLFFFDIDGC
jgi:hypothetical protein